MPHRLNRYHIASGLANNLFMGDLVIPTATSKNIALQGAVGDRVIGVFEGCNYIDSAGQTQFGRWPTGTVPLTGTTPDAFVCDDPRMVFEVEVTAAFALADIGALANGTLTAGNALTGRSAQRLDSATIGSGAVLKIVDYVRKPENEIGANAKVLVMLASHYLAGGLTAI
jgi:hypothetical protein